MGRRGIISLDPHIHEMVKEVEKCIKTYLDIYGKKIGTPQNKIEKYGPSKMWRKSLWKYAVPPLKMPRTCLEFIEEMRVKIVNVSNIVIPKVTIEWKDNFSNITRSKDVEKCNKKVSNWFFLGQIEKFWISTYADNSVAFDLCDMDLVTQIA